ncbi:glycosyltransferase family 2 protein [Parabacteroides sp.]
MVVDNNSKDGSVEIIINEFLHQVRVFPLKENIGFTKANNIGVQHAKG